MRESAWYETTHKVSIVASFSPELDLFLKKKWTKHTLRVRDVDSRNPLRNEQDEADQRPKVVPPQTAFDGFENQTKTCGNDGDGVSSGYTNQKP